MDDFAVVEFFYDIVNLGITDTHFVVWVFTSGENSEQEDFCVRAVLVDFADDGFDTLGGFGGFLEFVSGVVSADHDDGNFGVGRGELPVVESPEDVLGAVAREADVECIARGVIFSPNFFT